MLRIEDLRLGYPGRTLVEKLSAEFRPGELWAVLGRNGSGKTTLLHALAALLQPLAGRVMLGETMVSALPRRMLARHIGLLLQEESTEFWGSVQDYVLLGRYPHAAGVFGYSEDDQRIAQCELEAAHLGELRQRAYASLSGGERQRARAAALFAQRPVIYMLDEPLQHLDLPHQVAVLERLSAQAQERGAIVIMALHDLIFAARYCSRFLLLYGDGRYVLGTSDHTMTANLLSELYAFPLTGISNDGEQLFLPARQARKGPHV
ncbi:MAG TPA: ABC transporter ATP-binding protein [Burkholderiales bacterium]|nr:ABC transporter ATP-binding protein [Burkholderiales bacterium]